MNKKLLICSLILISTSGFQILYAHDTNTDYEKHKADREAKSQQEDRDTWDDFMKSVKAQETKPSNQENTEPENTSVRPATDHH